ncbi:MAG: DUF2007 domain-containing protein [Opitutaceae bacterium]|jgi:hypothetical protein
MRNGFASIATYADPLEAGMACERLCAAGIEAELTNTSAASSMYGAGNPIMNQVLLVEIERIEEARKLLAEAATAPDGLISTEEARVSAAQAYDGFYRTDWNARERAAETAYRASVIGWLVPGVSWYALWKLGEVAVSSLPLNGQARRHATIAVLMAALPALAWVGLLVVIAVT